MQKIFLFLIFILIPIGYTSTSVNIEKDIDISDSQELYSELELIGKVDYVAFEQAMEGYKKIDAKKKNIITLIDYSKPSTEERLFVIDLERKKLLFSSLVAHGKNSGGNYATSFSNKNGSYKSSLGFFITENTYKGKNGYSLVLNGLEKDINDNAKKRAIVIHGASYSNPSVITSGGRLGRSLGCPALPEAINKEIINTIKDGSILYIYANNKKYLAKSEILSEKKVLASF